ncbi:hypothetical protein OEA41_006111 [Lepraria neglecta]|uniref:SET domain-containing protein n=1 Tax=Lepraria neglecta TaxID=209136 RepID=A0AAD9Z7A3_9LECA|nr:hypothetical protein OEA41_006111 [Lepraria neglecta]
MKLSMAEISPPGPQHDQFTAWAKKKGVKINGVGPARISGRGLGIIAQRRIEAGEELVNVPASALLTVNSIPEDFKTLHKDITIHGLLASFLAFSGVQTSLYGPWKATWPSVQEFEESMPILWPAHLRKPLDCNGEPTNATEEKPAFLLPPAIGGRWRRILEFFMPREDEGLLAKQEKRMKADWKIVSKIFPTKTLEEYTYYWLVVNTRSFYFEVPGTTDFAHEDRMVLCPFVDYFNHNDHGCDVVFDESGYTVISDRAYAVGEEIQTSYGSHSNDFLLCEYGFILENNKFDYLPLDDFFSGKQVISPGQFLTAKHFLNLYAYRNYTLNSEGVCFRTQVAIRRQIMSTCHWKKFMAGTFEDDEKTRVYTGIELHNRILSRYEDEADEALKHLEKIGDAIPAGVKEVLTRRWRQIRDLVRQAMDIHEIRRI